MKAFQIGNATQVVSIVAASTLLTAFAGIIILKERNYIPLKIFASALATVGIILVQH